MCHHFVLLKCIRSPGLTVSKVRCVGPLVGTSNAVENYGRRIGLDWIGNCLIWFTFVNHIDHHLSFKIGLDMQKSSEVKVNILFLFK